MNNQKANNIIEDLITIISKNAKYFVSKGINSNKAWTKKNFTDLTELAYKKKYNYWVYTKPTDCDPTTTEWLYDMTWYESDDKGKIVIDIPLILESEWNKSYKEQVYDFQKLIQSRARIKVFVFQTQKGNVKTRIEELVKILEKIKLIPIDDRYVFIGWDDDVGYHYYEYISKKGVCKLGYNYDQF